MREIVRGVAKPGSSLPTSTGIPTGVKRSANAAAPADSAIAGVSQPAAGDRLQQRDVGERGAGRLDGRRDLDLAGGRGGVEVGVELAGLQALEHRARRVHGVVRGVDADHDRRAVDHLGRPGGRLDARRLGTSGSQPRTVTPAAARSAAISEPASPSPRNPTSVTRPRRGAGPGTRCARPSPFRPRGRWRRLTARATARCCARIAGVDAARDVDDQRRLQDLEDPAGQRVQQLVPDASARIAWKRPSAAFQRPAPGRWPAWSAIASSSRATCRRRR